MFLHRSALAGSALVVLAVLACSDAPVVPVQPTSRNVLAEVVFVDSTWGYCALAVRALDSLSRNRYDSAMPVVMYMTVGRFRMTAEDSARRSPPKHLYLDDTPMVNMDLYQSNEYGSVFADNIDVAKSQPSFVTMAVESTYADTADGVLVVMATADSVAPGADLRLVAIITEDSVITSGFLQARWDHMARRVVPDYTGRSIALARGDTLYDTLRFTTTGCNPAKLGAAVYIRDAQDGSIVQSLAVRAFNY